MTPLPWTPTELSVLLEMQANGCCTRDIGAAIDRTKNSVIGKLHRMGFCKPVGRADRWQADKIAALKTLLRNGHSFNSIADKLAVSSSSVRSKVHRDKLPAPQTYRIVRKPAPKVQLNEPPSLQLTILDLKSTTCRWPHSEPGDTRYCGQPAPIERPYCDYHHDLAHSKGTYSERRAADENDKRIAA